MKYIFSHFRFDSLPMWNDSLKTQNICVYTVCTLCVYTVAFLLSSWTRSVFQFQALVALPSISFCVGLFCSWTIDSQQWESVNTAMLPRCFSVALVINASGKPQVSPHNKWFSFKPKLAGENVFVFYLHLCKINTWPSPARVWGHLQKMMGYVVFDIMMYLIW